jgi:hypothetical protein
MHAKSRRLRSHPGRVVLIFVAAFAAILIPVGAGILITNLGPSRYLLHAEQLDDTWFSPQTFADDSTVVVYTAANANSSTDRIQKKDVTYSPGTQHYQRADNGRAGVLLSLNEHVIHIEGRDRAAVDSRLAQLPFVTENPEKSPTLEFVNQFLNDHAIGFVVGLCLYAVAFMLALPRAGSWAARIDPPPGLEPVAADVLRQRLLAINQQQVPFHVRELPRGRLVVEWNIVDAHWAGLLEAGGLKAQERMYVDLDPDSHCARVIYEQKTIRWSAGLGAAMGSFTFFRGIVFMSYESGAAAGLFFKDGAWHARPAYHYQFVLTEMKRPIVDAIIGAGWSFKPVVTFVRWIGG